MPDRIHLSLDPASQAFEPEGVVVFLRRIDLPWTNAGPLRETLETHARERWAEPWLPYAAARGFQPSATPPLPAEDIEDRGGFRVTSPLRSVLDAMTYRRHHDLSDVIDRGLRLGLFDLADLLQGTEGMLRLPGERALWELLRAVRKRAHEVERDLQTIRLRLLAVRHHNEQHFGPAWVRSGAEDELGLEDGDGEDDTLREAPVGEAVDGVDAEPLDSEPLDDELLDPDLSDPDLSDPTHDPAGPDLSTYRFTIEDAEVRGTLAPESVSGKSSAEE
jgi:hypothetical protein